MMGLFEHIGMPGWIGQIGVEHQLIFERMRHRVADVSLAHFAEMILVRRSFF